MFNRRDFIGTVAGLFGIAATQDPKDWIKEQTHQYEELSPVTSEPYACGGVYETEYNSSEVHDFPMISG